MADATLVERIQKLLAKTTEAGCTPAEAEAAFAMAARLMAQHNIDMATVEAHGGDRQAFGEDVVAECPRRSYLHALAGGIVKRFFFVEVYSVAGFVGGRRSVRYVLFGTPDNVATAAHVFRQFVAAAEHAWAEYKVRYRGEWGRPPARASQRDYFAGFHAGVNRKLTAERRRMVAETPTGSNGNALALVTDQISRAFKAAHPGMGTARPMAGISGDANAFGAGRAAGAAFNPARPIGGARKAIGQD